jgi:hypothetical protein
MKTTKKAVAKKPMMKTGGIKKPLAKAQKGTSVGVDWVNKGVANNIKKDKAGILTEADLAALAHQQRGMGEPTGYYVKKNNTYVNDLGKLTPAQQKQLDAYMAKASTARKVYEALPNVGAMFNMGASAIPKNSILQKQKKGGVVKKTVKKTITRPKKK